MRPQFRPRSVPGNSSLWLSSFMIQMKKRPSSRICFQTENETATFAKSWSVVPHYFFHVERDGERFGDDEGCPLPDLQSVQAIAVRAAADLAADDLKRGVESVEELIVVENEAGQDVVRVRVVATLELQAARPS